MAIRLNKALKELNVGINTAAEFLQKKGVPLEDASPNAKLTDDQYDLLVKEFGTDKTKHAEVKADIQKRKEKEEKEKQERKEQQRQEKERERKEKEEKEKEKEKKQQFKIVGNINDLKPQPATPEKKEKDKKK
ncbi:MAG: translation initiation factor IF-2, partial [Bacteroidaceae bacterium]|nr:translation initiation factor IF-2 [Bacteroidaceae bacterium]